jgi:hypothetical protein
VLLEAPFGVQLLQRDVLQQQAPEHRGMRRHARADLDVAGKGRGRILLQHHHDLALVADRELGGRSGVLAQLLQHLAAVLADVLRGDELEAQAQHGGPQAPRPGRPALDELERL